MPNAIEDRLAALSVVLPAAPVAAGSYVPFVLEAGLLVISGQLPLENGAVAVKGHLGRDVSLEDGQRAARICAVNVLAQAKAALGDLGRIRRCVRLGGFVSSMPDFTDQHKVMNGASDLIAQALGEAGRHARAAVGMASLPLNAAVEVEALFAVD